MYTTAKAQVREHYYFIMYLYNLINYLENIWGEKNGLFSVDSPFHVCSIEKPANYLSNLYLKYVSTKISTFDLSTLQYSTVFVVHIIKSLQYLIF